MIAPEPKVFEEPWHAQAFAVAVSLEARGVFSWREWTEAFGTELARTPAYYEAWLSALERLLVAKGAAAPGELAALAQAWREAAEATPHGQPIKLRASSSTPTTSPHQSD